MQPSLKSCLRRLVTHLPEYVKREFEVGLRVCCRDAEAEPCRALRNCGEEDRSGQDAVIAEPSGEERSRHLVLQNDGYDRRLREAGIIAQVLQTATQETGRSARFLPRARVPARE